MLDYFLTKGYVKMNEDGSITKTEICPNHLDFHEDETGIIKFHYKAPIYGRIDEIEDWESNSWSFVNDGRFSYVIEIDDLNQQQ